jgi:archaemetzincin
MSGRVLARAACGLLLLLTLAHTATAGTNMVIAIQPYGPVDATQVTAMRDALSGSLGCATELLPEVPLPAAAWHAPRSRYRAEKLLADLDVRTDRRFSIVMGITAADISTTKGDVPDWGVFGLGSVGGRTAVVSTFRLGRGVDRHQLHRRLGLVAIHEAGHVMGLDHCPRPPCVMEDCDGKVITLDKETGAFCESCRLWLKQNPR